MLGKLIKHECIATGRKYVVFYLVLAMVTLCNVLIQFISIDSVIIQGMKGIVMGLYVLTVIGVLFCSVGFAVIRFYKNMVSEEGYLTFTLPAKVEALVAAKLIVAFLWQLITVISCILSVSVMLFQGRENEFLKEGAELLKQVIEEYGGIVFAFLLFLAVSLLYQMIVYYLSIAIGQLFSGNKVLGAVAGYCLLNFALQIFMIAIVVVLGAVFSFQEIDAYMNSEQGLLIFLYVYSAFMACMAAGGFALTCRLLKKKLNLS